MKAIRALKRFIVNAAKPARIQAVFPSPPPLLLARRTYNTDHPDFAPELVRNIADKFSNAPHESQNIICLALKTMVRKKNLIPAIQWQDTLKECLQETKNIAFAEQVLSQANSSELAKGLFLYWLVRQLKPQKILQIGINNGFCSTFILLALIQNNTQGLLYLLNMPALQPSEINQQTIIRLFPESYHDRIVILNEATADSLPLLLENINEIDMLYHDSCQTYDQMMCCLLETKKILTTGGVMVSTNINTNASLWDFADLHMTPAYNHHGKVGVVCF